MATKKQRDFLKENLNNKFQIRKEFDEQVYIYYSNLIDDGYYRLGEVNQVIEALKSNEEWIKEYRQLESIKEL